MSEIDTDCASSFVEFITWRDNRVVKTMKRSGLVDIVAMQEYDSINCYIDSFLG